MKYFLVIFLIFCMLDATRVSALTTSRIYASAWDRAPGGGVKKRADGFGTVMIVCGTTACYLECFDSGSKGCNFSEASYCPYCNEDLANNADIQEMFDYAVWQIDTMNIEQGSYSSNILSSPVGNTYYRTIFWNVDTMAAKYNFEIFVTEVTP